MIDTIISFGRRRFDGQFELEVGADLESHPQSDMDAAGIQLVLR